MNNSFFTTPCPDRVEHPVLLIFRHALHERAILPVDGDAALLNAAQRISVPDDYVSEICLVARGLQDITAHVNFTDIAECGIDAGLEPLRGFAHGDLTRTL